MLYQELVSELPEPWKQLLRKTDLIPGVNYKVVLVVPPQELDLYSSLYVLQIVYPIAKKLYPNTKSLIVSYGNEYDLIKNGILELVDIR